MSRAALRPARGSPDMPPAIASRAPRTFRNATQTRRTRSSNWTRSSVASSRSVAVVSSTFSDCEGCSLRPLNRDCRWTRMFRERRVCYPITFITAVGPGSMRIDRQSDRDGRHFCLHGARSRACRLAFCGQQRRRSAPCLRGGRLGARGRSVGSCFHRGAERNRLGVPVGWRNPRADARLFVAALLMQLIGIWPAGVELAAGLGLAALALGGFYAVQRYGGARLLDRALAALAARWPSAGPATDFRLQEGLEAIWRNPRRVLVTTAMHMIGWLIGTLEILIALALMGHPVGLKEATIIESLTNAIRGAAFAVPGGFGVQEGGLVLLGHLMGLAPETALALSLVKRMPDLALGLPGLLAWHWLEVRRFFGARRPVPPAGAERGAASRTPPAGKP